MSNTDKINEALSVCQSINEIDVLVADYTDSQTAPEPITLRTNSTGIFAKNIIEKQLSGFYDVLNEKQLFVINEQQRILQMLDEEIYTLEEKKSELNKKLKKLEVIYAKISEALNNRI